MLGHGENFQESEVRELSSRHVLVVEDDEGLNKLAQKALRQARYDVQGVFSGAEAIKHAMANPDVALLLDINLPDMTGGEIVNTLRERNSLVPFIVMTGQGDEKTAVEMMKLGAGDYLVKGFGLFDRLPSAFQRLFRERDASLRLQAAEEALCSSEERLSKAFAASPDLFAITRISDGLIVDVNPAVEEYFGIPVKEAIGKTSIDLNTWADIADRNEVVATVRAGQPVRNVEYQFRKLSSGDIFHASLSCEVIDIDGEPHLISILRDLTDQKQADKEREKLESQLRQSQKMEAVGQLAGGVAHDFNNLLQAILGYTDLALGNTQDESPLQGNLQEIMKAGNRAAALVRQLLAFSRRQVLDMTDLDLNDTIIDLAKMIRRVIGEHIAFDIVADKDLGVVRADRGQIEQILMNLCVNARDAMPDGGKIAVETKNVQFDEAFCKTHPWAQQGQYVLIAVTDTGCGMDDETLANAFEPFFTTKDVGEGTGLGLATVYGLVKQHSGLVRVDSEIDKGSTFKVYLPRIKRPAAVVDDKIESPAPSGIETILLAEDEEMVRELTQATLKHAGYTVLTACDGEEALRLFDEHAGKIDLALLDVIMPNLGGRAVFEHIHKTHPEIPVLFSSGYSMDAIHTNFILNEGLTLIQKPFKRVELLRQVREVLQSSTRKRTIKPPAKV